MGQNLPLNLNCDHQGATQSWIQSLWPNSGPLQSLSEPECAFIGGPAFCEYAIIKIGLCPKFSQIQISIPVVLFCMRNSKFAEFEGFLLSLDQAGPICIGTWACHPVDLHLGCLPPSCSVALCFLTVMPAGTFDLLWECMSATSWGVIPTHYTWTHASGPTLDTRHKCNQTEPTVVNGSVHTGCRQHQRNCLQICALASSVDWTSGPFCRVSHTWAQSTGAESSGHCFNPLPFLGFMRPGDQYQ